MEIGTALAKGEGPGEEKMKSGITQYTMRKDRKSSPGANANTISFSRANIG